MLQVHVGDLGLDEVGQATLSLLAGPRYNAHSRVLKLTSDSLPLREQNKSYIQDLLVALVMEAQVCYPPPPFETVCCPAVNVLLGARVCATEPRNAAAGLGG